MSTPNDAHDGVTQQRITELEQRLDEVRRERDTLRERNAAYEVLLNEIPALAYFKDRQHRYVLVNRTYATTVRHTIDEIIGKTDAALFPPEVAAFYHDDDELVMASGVPRLNIEEPIEWSDGRPGWVVSYKVPYYIADGQVAGMVGVSLDITERKAAEEAQQVLLTQQQQLLATIQELSTPVLPVLEQTLVLPLVGHLDTARSQQITESLLMSVQQHQAKVVILDITGVPVVDTAVANALLRTTRAVGLLGARCVLTGVSPEIAQTIVQLGLDLGSLTIRRDLRDGIVYALAQQRQPL